MSLGGEAGHCGIATAPFSDSPRRLKPAAQGDCVLVALDGCNAALECFFEDSPGRGACVTLLSCGRVR
jgi:hypothetical protein